MIKQRTNNIYYKKCHDELNDEFQKNSDWYALFYKVVSSNTIEYKEVFVDLVNEVYKTNVISVEQIQNLTGIKEALFYDYKTDEFIDSGDKEEAAAVQLTYVLNSAFFSRYYNTIVDALENGTKYKDLFKIEPKDFNLPEEWNFGKAKNKETTITVAIWNVFKMSEPAGLTLLPSLRAISKHIDAPYSIIMNSFNIYK